MKVNYDEMTITYEGMPSKDALKCYYKLLIDSLIKDYGKEKIEKVMGEIIK